MLFRELYLQSRKILVIEISVCVCARARAHVCLYIMKPCLWVVV